MAGGQGRFIQQTLKPFLCRSFPAGIAATLVRVFSGWHGSHSCGGSFPAGVPVSLVGELSGRCCSYTCAGFSGRHCSYTRGKILTNQLMGAEICPQRPLFYQPEEPSPKAAILTAGRTVPDVLTLFVFCKFLYRNPDSVSSIPPRNLSYYLYQQKAVFHLSALKGGNYG